MKIIAPVVILLSAYFTGFQFRGSIAPLAHQSMDSFCFLVLCRINGQTIDIARCLDTKTVSVFQCEKRVHDANIWINIRYLQRFRSHTKYIRQLCCQFCFRVLLSFSYWAMRTSALDSGNPTDMPRYFIVSPRSLRKKRILSPIAMNTTSHSQIFLSFKQKRANRFWISQLYPW